MFPNGNDLQSKKKEGIRRMRYKRRFRRFSGKRGIRRNMGTWFPTLGTEWQADGGGLSWFDAGFTLNTLSLNENKANGSNGVVIPVTKDFTQLPSSNFGTITGAGLRDEVEGQSWLLKRLVGNIFCQYVNADGNSDPSQFWRQALVTAGFFVSRNIDSIQGRPDLDYDEYDPMFLDNITNPWIWRRSWILSNPGKRRSRRLPHRQLQLRGGRKRPTHRLESQAKNLARAAAILRTHTSSDGTASGVKSSPWP